METTNKIISRDGTINVPLDVYVFMDQGAYIAYPYIRECVNTPNLFTIINT